MTNKEEILSLCYAPYSGSNEACYVEGESGLFYPGVRVENISYPLTITAIRAAICSCLANEDKPKTYYHVAGKSELSEYWIHAFDLAVSNELPANFEIFDPIVSTNAEENQILVRLERLCEKAVTIHSDFPVSALLLTEKGWLAGVNVEVSAWSLGLCAERVAICRAISHGIKEYRSIHVHAPKSEFCSPCGSCRQILSEFMDDKEIGLYHKDRSLSRHIITHLLPYGIITDFLK